MALTLARSYLIFEKPDHTANALQDWLLYWTHNPSSFNSLDMYTEVAKENKGEKRLHYV